MSPMIDPADLARLADLWQSVAVGALLRGTILLAACGASALLMRRMSASSRHLWWTAGIVGLLLIPMLSATMPRWEVELPLLQAEAEQPAGNQLLPAANLQNLVSNSTPTQFLLRPAGTDVQLARLEPAVIEDATEPALFRRAWASAKEQMASFSTSTWILLGWELGALLVLSFFGFGRLRLWMIERASVELTEGEWVDQIDDLREEMGMRTPLRVLQSRDSMTPMTWGIFRPVILIPKEADEWDPAQRHDVLMHELHHVRRHDCLSQTLAQLACVLYWFHPLAWFAAGRMRDERERACDDQVLMAGSKASSYASHLLEMARSLRAEESTAFASVAMARRSQLSDRLVAVLDPQLDRSGPSRMRLLSGGLLAAGFVLFLAALQPVTAAPPDRELMQRKNRSPRPEIALPPVPRAYVVREPRRAPRAYALAEPKAPTHVHAPRAEAWVRPVIVGDNGYAFVAPGDGVSVVSSGGTTAYARSGDIDGSLHIQSENGSSQWMWNSDSHRLWIEVDGVVEFNDDDSDIAYVSPDGYFEIGSGKGRGAKRLEIEADDDGNLTRAFFDGRKEAPFDEDAQKWLAETLDLAIRQTGIGADVRAKRLYENGGLRAVLDEIDTLDSDHVRKLYFGSLLGLDDLSDEERQEVLGKFAREIDSDYERAQLLLQNVDDFMRTDASREAYFDAVEGIGSDYERGRVIQSAFERGDLSPKELARALEASEGIGSDYERSQILRRVQAPQLADQALRDAYFRNVDDIGSDYERSQVLQALLEDAEDDPELAGRILKAVLDVDSDYERAQVLVSTAHTYLKYSELHDLYFDAVEEIGSDYERARVLLALMEEAELGGEQQLRLVEIAGDIGSDFEKANLLAEIAQMDGIGDEVFEALAQQIDTIGSEHEYGRAMKALRRAQRRSGS